MVNARAIGMLRCFEVVRCSYQESGLERGNTETDSDYKQDTRS